MIDFESDYYDYLKKYNYSESTRESYIYSIKRVMKREKIWSWEQLGDKIDLLCVRYDVGGEEQEFGSKSDRTIINALKRYNEYFMTTAQYLEKIENFLLKLKQGIGKC
ncbi:MAG: hypothetical protein E7176_01670 [Erysipelotrichaceae bacterium]|nr:hypothetical protein [Erysipelotrichaceae bacterium]